MTDDEGGAVNEPEDAEVALPSSAEAAVGDERRYVNDPDGRAAGRPSSSDEFGRRGWLLLAGVFVAFVVVPLVIYVRPPGLPFVVAYLVLPLVPAVLLAMLAVWATT